MSTTPSLTPNVRIESPSARKVIGNVLGYGTLALSAATIVDQAIPAVDYSYVTGPAAVILAGFLSLFQLVVTSPNVPAEDGRANGLANGS